MACVRGWRVLTAWALLAAAMDGSVQDDVATLLESHAPSNMFSVFVRPQLHDARHLCFGEVVATCRCRMEG